jgi:hypothetical protein
MTRELRSKAATRGDKRRTTRQAAVRKAWVVTTSSERPIREIAKDLSTVGFEVDRTLDEIGVITGTCDDEAVRKARAVRGVTDVSPEPKVHIAPPSSRDTW